MERHNEGANNLHYLRNYGEKLGKGDNLCAGSTQEKLIELFGWKF